MTLNETALQQLPDDKKPLFIFEWLRFLDKVLVAASKVIIVLNFDDSNRGNMIHNVINTDHFYLGNIHYKPQKSSSMYL